jgi:hypothetical protein
MLRWVFEEWAMGKRGPAPTSDQKAVLSTRITPVLRKQIEDAAKRNGQTLSREIELRLRRTFLEDRDEVLGFGDERTYAVARYLLASAIPMTNARKRDAHWTSDPYLFDQVVREITQALEWIRPEGGAPSLDDSRDQGGLHQGVFRAAELLRDIKQADPPEKTPASASTQKRIAARLKPGLGEIAERARLPYRETTWAKEIASGALVPLDDAPATKDKKTSRRKKS